MAAYLLVGASDPAETIDGRRLYEVGGGLVEHGDDVTVFLVQNGVLACRPRSATGAALAELAAGATVLADDFSLRERGIAAREIVPNVRVASIDALVDAALEGDRTVTWF